MLPGKRGTHMENLLPDVASPMSNIRNVGSKDKIKGLGSPVSVGTSILNVSNGSLDSCGSNDYAYEKIRRVASSSSIVNVITGSGSHFISMPYSSIYTKIWQGIINLSSDPHTEVNSLANSVILDIKAKALRSMQPREHSDPKPLASQSPTVCVSAPSSPASRTSYLSDNLTTGCVSPQDIPRSITVAGRFPMQHNSNTIPFQRSRKYLDRGPGVIQEEMDEDSSYHKSPLITTKFVEQCCIYFVEPNLKHPEENDPESTVSHEREWKYLRNARCRRKAEDEQRRASTARVDDQVFINKNQNPPTLMKFHPYDFHLFVADKDYISIWGWDQGVRLSSFNNHKPLSSRITSMELINSHDNTLLMIGSDEGAIRVWRNYLVEDGKEPELVTAWQAFPDMLPSNRGAGLILEWEQGNSFLFAAGDVRTIRIWDCEKEMSIRDIPTGADSCVTSLCLNGSNIIAGFGDGTVRIYDRRISSNECRIRTLREHSSWIVSVGSTKHSSFSGQFFSGSVVGDVRLWDFRNQASLKTFQTCPAMTAMSVHPAADIFACGSANQLISVYNGQGENLSNIKYHDGFIGQRIGAISCLSFHPHKISLAAGSMDSIISVYSIERKS